MVADRTLADRKIADRKIADRKIGLVLRDTVRFGRGEIASLAGLVAGAAGTRAFIVTDRGVIASGVIERVRASLDEGGIATGVFDGVEPNPGTATIERGSSALREFGLEGTVVVPVGGGSAMDTAKAVSLHAVNDVGVWELGYDDESLAPGVPLVAVPTTAGTGAETNSFGVITDDAARRKSYIGHPSLLPVATVLDPDLTLGLPPAATAATGIDAMTHSLESLLSRNPNPFAEAIALYVIRTIGEWLPRAVANGADVEARSQLLFAAHLAGVGQASGTGVGLVHAVGHALGTRGHLPHGTALAAVLPEILEFDIPVRARELALVGIALGAASPIQPPEEAAHAAVAAVDALARSVGQRRSLRELGLSRDQLPVIVADALADPAINNTPRLPEAHEVGRILEAVAG